MDKDFFDNVWIKADNGGGLDWKIVDNKQEGLDLINSSIKCEK